MKKRREMIENNTTRDRIEYVEICKTIKKKAREDIRKQNLEVEKGQKNTQSRQKPDDDTSGQTRQIDPRTR